MYLAAPDGVSDSGGWAWTAGGKWLVASVQIDEVIGLDAVATDGSGGTLSVSTHAGADPIYMGSVRDMQIRDLFLPLVMRA